MRFCFAHYLQTGQVTEREGQRRRARGRSCPLNGSTLSRKTPPQPSHSHPARKRATAWERGVSGAAGFALDSAPPTPLKPNTPPLTTSHPPKHLQPNTRQPTAHSPHPAPNQKRTQPSSHAPLSLFHKYLKPRRSPRRPHHINGSDTVSTPHDSTDRGAMICGSRRHDPIPARPEPNRKAAQAPAPQVRLRRKNTPQQRQ